METGATGMITTLESFIELFRGRGDAYGSWDGGCVRKALNADTFKHHLEGTEMIGVYPHVYIHDGWKCVWGCSDIDVEDLDSAMNLKTALAVKNVPAWVERTRKGYHVWVFVEARSVVTTKVMRRALLAAHQAINYVAKEVNPKQEDPGKGYGNYVRLPYPSGFTVDIPENRYMLDADEKPINLETFITQVMDGGRATVEALEAVASMYKEPERRTVIIDCESEDINHLLPKLNRAAFTYWQDGPIQGRDRSNTLVRLAHLTEQCGLNASESFAILRNADLRWGKFHTREDGEEQIMKIVSHVYGAAT